MSRWIHFRCKCPCADDPPPPLPFLDCCSHMLCDNTDWFPIMTCINFLNRLEPLWSRELWRRKSSCRITLLGISDHFLSLWGDGILSDLIQYHAKKNGCGSIAISFLSFAIVPPLLLLLSAEFSPFFSHPFPPPPVARQIASTPTRVASTRSEPGEAVS